MSKKQKNRKGLEEVLRSVSDVLFPAELGERPVKIDSRDETGDIPRVNLLIESGADINAIGDMGEPPLQIALRQRDVPIIESLLRAGARTDITPYLGNCRANRFKIGRCGREIIYQSCKS
jgi:uncharacterized protein